MWERGSKLLFNAGQQRYRQAPISFGASGEWRDLLNGPALHLAATGYVDTTSGRFGTVGLLATSTERWTVCCRCKVNASSLGVPFARSGGGATNTRQLALNFNRPASATQTPNIIVRGTATNSSWNLDDGTWHTIWMVWDGATCTGYFDNAQGTLSIGVGAVAEETAENILIGARTSGAPVAFLDGDIDFFAILDVPLSAAQIARWNRDLLAPWRPSRRVWRAPVIAGPITATGAVWSDLRASGVAVAPVGAAASARIEPRTSGTGVLPLGATGKIILEPRTNGVVAVAIVGTGKTWLDRLPPVGFASLGGFLFTIPARRRPKKVVRLEVWDKHPYAGGVCLGVLRWWHRGLRRRRGLNAEETWTAVVPGAPAFVQKDRILRPVWNDGSHVERIITEATKTIGPSGELSTSITAEHLAIELGIRTQTKVVEDSGRVRHRFDRSSLTGRQHLDQFAIQIMKDKGFTYWETGIVERDRLLARSYDSDNPISTALGIRDDLGLELSVRDDGVSKLYVDLVAMTGGQLPIMPARYARNLGPASVLTRIEDQATVVYPKARAG
jgi:hypothetical protein